MWIERLNQVMRNSACSTGRRGPRVGGVRWFTVAEANRSLVLVKRIVADVISLHRRLLSRQEAYVMAETRCHDAELENARRELFDTGERLRICLNELEQVGVALKDWSLGIVDFPCLVGGAWVQLCWRWGEATVRHWHEVDEGFANRKTLDSLPKQLAGLASTASKALNRTITSRERHEPQAHPRT